MKKPIYLFSLSFMIGASLLSCKDNARETETVAEEEINTTVDDTEATQDNYFAQYDANRDNQWDENEFSESYQGEFSGYDQDTSGDLNNQEFTGATFRSTDRNRDNSINRQEWNEGYNNNFGDYANQEDFNAFDTDQSGDLSDTEWNEGFGDTEWFNTYDSDRNGTVSDQEWTKSNFSRWDRNGDGYLNQQEFQAYNQAMMGNNTGNNTNMNSQNRNNTNQTGTNQTGNNTGNTTQRNQ